MESFVSSSLFWLVSNYYHRYSVSSVSVSAATRLASTGSTLISPFYFCPRPFNMRSDSELLIFIFRSEKRMGLLTQSDFAESDGM